MDRKLLILLRMIIFHRYGRMVGPIGLRALKSVLSSQLRWVIEILVAWPLLLVVSTGFRFFVCGSQRRLRSGRASLRLG
jgi:hypothetical protein